MLRIRLTTADVSRIRFAAAPAPVLETALMLFELRRPRVGEPWPAWRPQVLHDFPAEARPLGDLFRAHRCVYCFDVLVAEATEGFAAAYATPTAEMARYVNFVWPNGRMPVWVRQLAQGGLDQRRMVDRAIRSAYHSCVVPRWSFATESFEADIAARMAVLRYEGVAGLLNALDDGIRLDGDELQISSPWSHDFDLRGRGLILIPSAFWRGRPLITWDQQEPSQHVIIYAARSSEMTPTGSGDALAALLGATRIRVLRSLARPMTTSGVARALGISVPSASQHAATLREAGLITSRRDGQVVEHYITGLGRSLLRSRPFGSV